MMTRKTLLHVLIVAVMLATLSLPDPVYAATFVVTTPADAPDPFPGDGICGIIFSPTYPHSWGPCSLRAAIQEVNIQAGPHQIQFAIGASGVQTINLYAELPSLIRSVVIDGWSQGGAAYSGPPLIELNGTSAGAGARGLVLVSDGSTVRGLAINRFDGSGITVSGSSNVIKANVIGADASGTTARGNRRGIQIDGQSNQIGGLYPYERNLISGNAESGILLNPLAGNNQIVGNYIGTTASGAAALGNGVGILIWGYRNVIGGIASGSGNVIAFNSGPGVEVGLASSGTWHNPILRNSIFANGALGIDLAATIGGRADGVTANDQLDSDVGANFLQNYPVLTSASPGPNSTVAGTLNSEPSTTYWIDVYANPDCDPSGHGEGRTYYATIPVTTNASGTVSFSASVPPLMEGFVVTATATRLDTLDTSEFSACRTVSTSGTVCTPRPNVKVQTQVVGSGQLRATLTAQTLPGTPTNSLQQITFTKLDNAQVLVNGSPVGVGVVVPLGGAQTFTFTVARTAPGPVTVHFVVKDGCGDWKSFVGGGPNAF